MSSGGNLALLTTPPNVQWLKLQVAKGVKPAEDWLDGQEGRGCGTDAAKWACAERAGGTGKECVRESHEE